LFPIAYEAGAAVLKFILGRSIRTLVVVAIATGAIFFMVRSLPGDPAQALLGQDASAEALEGMRRTLMLDRSPVEQYFAWLGQVARGELGVSYRSRQPVTGVVAQALPVSLTLLVFAMAWATLFAIVLGTVAAYWRGQWPDTLISTFTAIIYGVPSFWLGLLLIIGFALTLRWFPTGGYVPFTRDAGEALRSIALPALTLGSALAGALSRFVRASVMETLSRDYVTTARAKGVKEFSVVRRHVLRNSLIPVITVLGIQMGAVLGGAVVIEVVFNLPGLGRLVVDAVRSRDYPVLQGGLLVLMAWFALVNLAVDIAYGLLDPRVRAA
jgi:peptide/nickel transport system permease protein